MKKLLLFTSLLFSFLGFSQTLDTTFNGSGIVTSSFSNSPSEEQMTAAEMQSDGKMVYLLKNGYPDGSISFIARYNVNGTLDNSFNSCGFRVFNDNSKAFKTLKIQSDGKIVIVAISNAKNIYRLNPDGSLDASFGINGHITLSNSIFGYAMIIKSIQIQTDNKIIIGGTNSKVIRLNEDGSIDSSFGTNGIVNLINITNDIAIQDDNKIILVGQNNNSVVTVRLNLDGSPDTSFGVNGIGTTFSGTNAIPASVAIHTDNKISIFVMINTTLAFIRYNSDGTLDTSFDLDGLVQLNTQTIETPSIFYKPILKLTSNGQIIVSAKAAWAGNAYVLKLKLNGSIDTSFGTNGIYTGIYYNPCHLIIKANDQIITCGSNNGQYKFNLTYNGTLSSSTNFHLKQTADEFNSTIEQADGKIITLSNRNSLARYNQDGSIDNSFGSSGIINSPSYYHYSLKKQFDNKFLMYHSEIDPYIIRFDSEGILDSTFGNNGILSISTINSSFSLIDKINETIDNKLYVLHRFNTSNNFPTNYGILKLNNDGTPDTSFGVSGNLSGHFGFFANETELAYDMIIQSDNKIVVIFGLYTDDTTTHSTATGVARFNQDGSLDTTFGTNGKIVIESNNYIQPKKIVLLENDRFAINTDINYGQTQLYKFNSNGTFDTTFGNNGILTDFGNYNYDVIVQPDFKILKSSNTNNQFTIARYDNITGAIDTTFGNNGIINTPIGLASNINQLTWLQNNSLLASGTSFNGTNEVIALARYVNLNLGTIYFSNENAALLLYPNPIKDEATFEYSLQNDEIVSIEIIDMQGRIVQTIIKNKELLQGNYKQSINLSIGVVSGNYILKFSTSKGSESIKIIKK